MTGLSDLVDESETRVQFRSRSVGRLELVGPGNGGGRRGFLTSQRVEPTRVTTPLRAENAAGHRMDGPWRKTAEPDVTGRRRASGRVSALRMTGSNCPGPTIGK
jgi:hypothetical protein